MRVRCHICGRQLEFQSWIEFLNHIMEEVGFVYVEGRGWIKPEEDNTQQLF